MSVETETLRKLVADREAIVVAGAGVAIAASGGAPQVSFRGILESGVRWCEENLTGLDEGWGERMRASLRSGDRVDQLTVMSQLDVRIRGEDRGSWLEECFGGLPAVDRTLIEALRDLDAPIVTTNFDGLIEDVTGWPAVTWRDPARVERVLLSEEEGVIHLHGYWREPDSVLLGIRSYDLALDAEHVRTLRRVFRNRRRFSFLFLGYAPALDATGASFPEYLRRTFGDPRHQHYWLMLDSELDALRETGWREEVEPWIYGEDFADRVPLLRSLAPAQPRTVSDSARHPLSLARLELTELGPSRHFCYEPAERLNLVTGDNSLGKTFLLDCAWWALTGEWPGAAALPRLPARENDPEIRFTVRDPDEQTTVAHYDWERQSWPRSNGRERWIGLALYARHDGSFSCWDPARSFVEDDSQEPWPYHTFFHRQEVWDGLTLTDRRGQARLRSNGLLRDWITWQTGGQRYAEVFEAFTACLRRLSPSHGESLEPGEPTRLPGDAREIPTLRMPYGDVPVVNASAGVQRVLTLAYLIVWTWYEHLTNARLARWDPRTHLELLVDELEAHLHPRWQRRIVPALLEVMTELSPRLQIQAHLATHSPMVLASAEEVFDVHVDALHHLELDDEGNVALREIPFVKHGRGDAWLTSEVFGLRQARSLPAEEAIEAAKALQLEEKPDPREVGRVDARLVRVLADDDEFWPRWRFFAERHRPRNLRAGFSLVARQTGTGR